MIINKTRSGSGIILQNCGWYTVEIYRSKIFFRTLGSLLKKKNEL